MYKFMSFDVFCYLWCKVCYMGFFLLQSCLRHKHWKIDILYSKLFYFPIKEVCKENRQ